jgi:TRAP-type mannitol/chloroaromatic compound transport system permease small subunit
VEGLLKFARGIDRMSGWIGRATGWLVLAMVLIGSFNAIVRYLGRSLGANLSSNAYIEAQWYLFSLVFLLGGAYALSRDSHVRVDVLYGRLSERTRAWIDLVGTVLFLIPFCLYGLWVSWPWVVNSWKVREISPDPEGLVRYPLKAMVLVAFTLLLLQGIAHGIRQVARLRGQILESEAGSSDDPSRPSGQAHGGGHA